MTVIVTRDGQTFGGATSEAAVMQMCNAGILTIGKSLDEYMEAVSSNCYRLNGWDIAHDSADRFLRDLEAHGLITLGAVQ